MSVSISSVLIPAATLGAMGLFFGALLAVSSKLFHVEQDPRIGEVDVYKRQRSSSALSVPHLYVRREHL